MNQSTTKQFFAELCDSNPAEANRLMQSLQASLPKATVEPSQPVDDLLSAHKINARFEEERRRVTAPAQEEYVPYHVYKQFLPWAYAYYSEQARNKPVMPPSDLALSQLAEKGADLHYIQTGVRAFEPVYTPTVVRTVTLEELKQDLLDTEARINKARKG